MKSCAGIQTPIKHHSGFTLLEVLVALAITSLIMALLMGASYYVMQVRVRLVNEVHQGETEVRNQLWFREVVASIQPAPRESSDTFEGSPTEWRGFVLLPLDGDPHRAAPQVVTMSIEALKSGENALIYRAGDSAITIASWPFSNVRFAYQTSSGQLLEYWKSSEQGVERTPRGIQIKVANNANAQKSEDFSWYARIDADPWMRPPRAPDFLLGAGG
ncbi:type II secretion system protein J [Chitinimonas sp. BJYL2]|uniref:PulJ/GspJ family protein n=1 Tax=Chitinimonas sp. BJYL2 TaxID=2976696 RepID=UPI0022B33E9F|nr:prepilin-type N-terminal cleavage/methylation domain-containing protein [Chitinimonas sp. BJYL2]